MWKLTDVTLFSKHYQKTVSYIYKFTQAQMHFSIIKNITFIRLFLTSVKFEKFVLSL